MRSFSPGLHSPAYERVVTRKRELSMPDEQKEMIDIAMPEIYPGMKTAKVTFWIFEEDEVDIIAPNDQLLRVETEHAYYNIPVPPWVATVCRVKDLYKRAGEQVIPGDVLIRVEPV